jgi:hypothetical protein
MAGRLWLAACAVLLSILSSTARGDAQPAGTPSKPAENVQSRPSGAPVQPQRVLLYEEEPGNAYGKQFNGTATWRTEFAADPVAGTDIAIRADIDVPERALRFSLSIRRNLDQSLPASHTLEFTIEQPPEGAGGIASLRGVLMKSGEQMRGTPLAGLAVKVTDGFFMIGLSNVEADLGRNLQLLKERAWFDVALVYGNGRRAIVALAKGPPGEEAFAAAFDAWTVAR